MNNLKGFCKENKQLVMITASVILGIFIIFTVIAVIVSKNGVHTDNGGKEENAAEPSTSLTAQETAGDTTDMAEEATTGGDIAHQEETTPENSTEPETIDPDTMPYKIRVNRAANCITVYAKDESGQYTNPVKAITCSTGKTVGDTPLGTFSTLLHYDWLYMVDGSYGQYAYRFFGPILFHSVPYYSKNKSDLEWEQYNKLGEPASLGCVRVCVADAIWLIENCGIGTGVEVYDDASNPGPLGKPDTIKIPENSPYRGWDPTDPDKNNPWHQYMPEIKVSQKSVTVEKGSSDEQLKSELGAAGYDTCGNDVTDKIVITEVDMDKAGTYNTVKLNLTDAIGKSAAEVTVSVTVKEQETMTPEPEETDETESESESESVSESESKSESDSSSGEEDGSNEQNSGNESETTTDPEHNSEPDGEQGGEQNGEPSGEQNGGQSSVGNEQSEPEV